MQDGSGGATNLAWGDKLVATYGGGGLGLNGAVAGQNSKIGARPGAIQGGVGTDD